MNLLALSQQCEMHVFISIVVKVTVGFNSGLYGYGTLIILHLIVGDCI